MLDIKVAETREGCATALRWVYEMQGWTGAKIEKRIKGLKASTWRRYAERGYPGSRSLHAVAAFSWVSQVSMTALYKGSNIADFWGFDDAAIRVIVNCALLRHKPFLALMDMLFIRAKSLGVHLDKEVFRGLEELERFSESEYMAPAILNLNDFKFDYYRSIAQVLVGFRKVYGLSVRDVSRVLGVKENIYIEYENPVESTRIPLQLAMRMKFGFRISDTTEFLGEMKKYPGFHLSRKIQQLKEDVIFMFLSKLDKKEKYYTGDLAKEYLGFHQKAVGGCKLINA